MIDAKDLREKDNLLKIPNDKPGYYKWWAKREQLNLLLKELNVSFDSIEKYLDIDNDLFCIYVGIAVRESIRARLNWHVNDKHKASQVKNGTLSTFRQSISSIVAHNQYDKESTNKFIDLLKIEYFELDFPIKSEIAKEKLHKIERELLSKNLYILNIQENKFEQAKPIKTTLKRLRKESKKVDNEKYM